MRRTSSGFTMIEMVMVLVMIGILAVAVLPRLQTGEYRALEFRDKSVAALRYAQKTATSHRRLVCVAFGASTLALTIDHDNSGACDGQVLNLPGGASNVVSSGDAINVVFDPVPANFMFQRDGTGADRTVSVAGQPAIVVVGATGHVR